MSDIILGISAFYHDSAAAIVEDGAVVAAAHEERFTRNKHDSSFPINAITYVLDEANIEGDKLTAVAFYDKPYLKFERLLETYHAFAPKGLTSFLSAIPVWIKEKLFLKNMIREELEKLGVRKPKLFFPEHHLSHAASAFFPSPFNNAAILTIDGVGEWATTTIGKGEGNQIEILRELHFPHSVGLLYSAFTYYTGFRVNSGEYKMMGLAPYGNPKSEQKEIFKKKIIEEIVDIRDDGSILLNMDYFKFATGLTMTHDRKWERLFEMPRREAETEITQPYMNMALAVQEVTEDIVLKLAATTRELTGSRHLAMAGGVALNSVANERLLNSGLFDDIWIQPASGDAGGAVGAAYAAWHIGQGNVRTPPNKPDGMQGALLGPAYGDRDILKVIKKYGAEYSRYDNLDELIHFAAEKLDEGNVVGWFQGRMEYGPRALGCRSILGDARNPDMQKKMNLKIKYREGFRPFAPSVLEEDIQAYFEIDRPSPYMLFVIPVCEVRRKPAPDGYDALPLYERLYHLRSDIPAVTHIDYSARIQSVNRDVNPRYWKVIRAFKELTGYGVIINTSFNVRGEPIVCTPEDAFRCFMRTEMDYLVMESFLFDKSEQQEAMSRFDWKENFEPD